MSTLQRHCDEIVTQTRMLVDAVQGADFTTPVPTCPEWHLGQLLRHLGGAHRQNERIVRTRATTPPSADASHPAADDDYADLLPWLVDGATRLVATLREAGPDRPVWVPVLTQGTTGFYARRMACETAVHRADAALAVGAGYSLDADVAVDAMDEWLELGALPMVMQLRPERRELLGPDRTVHLHATDTAAEWVVDLTGDAMTWRKAHEKSAVAVRAPVTDLLLLVYGRRSPSAEGIDVFGDANLLDFWLRRVAFG
jgi:uncharacterized protein (TIGR03083 family)